MVSYKKGLRLRLVSIIGQFLTALSMNPFKALAILLVFFVSASAQQWTAQQMEAYRQQYYNWWYNQQRMQQATQAPAPIAPTPHPIWGNAQSDSKGNYWHGDDNAKILLIARSSWP